MAAAKHLMAGTVTDGNDPMPLHLARPGWVVLCGDRCVRHSGTFSCPEAAEHWAAIGSCCPSPHWVIKASAHAGLLQVITARAVQTTGAM